MLSKVKLLGEERKEKSSQKHKHVTHIMCLSEDECYNQIVHSSPNSNRQCLCSAEQSREEAAVWSIWRPVCSFECTPAPQPQSPWPPPKLPQRLWGWHFPRGTFQHFLWRKVSHRWAVVLGWRKRLQLQRPYVKRRITCKNTKAAERLLFKLAF